jgi:molybdate transport system substrate-binding protein
LLRFIAVLALILAASSGVSAQTEVTLLAPNPYRRTLDKLVTGFEMKTGYKLKVTLGRGLGTRDQVARGEIYDVNILLPPYPEALASGNIDPKSATTIAKLILAVGVKKGAAKPDISTPEKLKNVVLAASSVAFVDPMVGSDGFSTQEALQKMGLLDQLSPKIKHAQTATAVSQLVAKGDADLCIFYRNEMAENANVDVVAALPRQFAEPGPIVAFISTKVHDAQAAKTLIDYLSSPDAQAFYEKEGFEAAR